MWVYSTITSPVFSEVVILVEFNAGVYFPSQVPFFDTLRTMNEIRPFKLVFLLTVLDRFREEAQQKLVGALDSVTARGLLDFLDSPPTIRSTGIYESGWDKFVH